MQDKEIMSKEAKVYTAEFLVVVKKFLATSESKIDIGSALNATILYLRDTLEVNGIPYE